MLISGIFTFLALLHLAVSQSATLTEAPDYSKQLPCAKDCFYIGAFAGPDRLANNIGCDSRDIQNECLCRPDLQTRADAFLKSCVNSLCSRNTFDIGRAVSIYNAYCTNAGFQRATPATTTSGTDEPPSTVTVTMIATVTVLSSAQKRFISPLQILFDNLAGFTRIGRGLTLVP